MLDNVHGVDVLSCSLHAIRWDQHLVELLIMIDAMKRASAARITAVVPYYGYATSGSEGSAAGGDQCQSSSRRPVNHPRGRPSALFVDLHAAQIQGFFNIPVDHMFSSPVLVSHFKELKLPNLIVVSPDAGGVERARHFARRRWGPRWPLWTSGAPTSTWRK